MFNKELEKDIFKAFYRYFREVKGFADWTDEEIEMSSNDDDLIDFISYIFNYTTSDIEFNLKRLEKKIIKNTIKINLEKLKK